MIIRNIALFIFLATSMLGCSLTDISNSIKGRNYMASGDYQEAEKTFQKAVRDSPDNALGHYYLGRFLLAQGKTADALPHFQQSVAIDREDAEYIFWLGVTYGELDDIIAERSHYERSIELEKDHPQANLYLGHIQLRTGELTPALKSYDTVLKKVPTNPAALYNRALILDIQGLKTAAQKAWRNYLRWYPAGQQAIQAANNLNALGDFLFENHHFGRRTVTLSEIKFQQSDNKVSKSSYPTLKLVGAIVANFKKGKLQIIVFKNHNKKIAQERALNLKKTLHVLFPGIFSDRIQVSWFGAPEKTTQNGNIYSRDQSVRFFLTDWK